MKYIKRKTLYKTRRETTMMNSVEIKNAIRDTAARAFLNDHPDALAINGKDYTFVIPVEIEGKTYWAKAGFTSCAYSDTKSRPAFNPETDATPALEAFDNMLAEREANRLAREAKKKEKAKSKDEDDE